MEPNPQINPVLILSNTLSRLRMLGSIFLIDPGVTCTFVDSSVRHCIQTKNYSRTNLKIKIIYKYIIKNDVVYRFTHGYAHAHKQSYECHCLRLVQETEQKIIKNPEKFWEGFGALRLHDGECGACSSFGDLNAYWEGILDLIYMSDDYDLLEVVLNGLNCLS